MPTAVTSPSPGQNSASPTGRKLFGIGSETTVHDPGLDPALSQQDLPPDGGSTASAHRRLGCRARRSTEAGQFLGPGEDVLQHRRREAAGEGVLLADVVAAHQVQIGAAVAYPR